MRVKPIKNQRDIEFNVRINTDPHTIQRLFSASTVMRDYWSSLQHQNPQIVIKNGLWKLYLPYKEQYSELSTIVFNAYGLNRKYNAVNAVAWIYFVSLFWCCKRDDYWERYSKVEPILEWNIRKFQFVDDPEWESVKDRVADLSSLWLATSINNGKVPWKNTTMKHIFQMDNTRAIFTVLRRTGIAKRLNYNGRLQTIYFTINEDIDEDLWADLAELSVKSMKTLEVGAYYRKYGIKLNYGNKQ